MTLIIKQKTKAVLKKIMNFKTKKVKNNLVF